MCIALTAATDDSDTITKRSQLWINKREASGSNLHVPAASTASLGMDCKKGGLCTPRCSNGRCALGTPARLVAAHLIGQEGNDTTLTDIYQFGVYTGGSIQHMRRGWQLSNLSIGSVWGFDSFVGLQVGAKTAGDTGEWFDGAFSAADALGVYSMSALKQQILQYITETNSKVEAESDWFGKKTKFIKGFFNVSLTPTLAHKRRMQPARYVDIDVDQYLPTVQVLDWMLTNGLIRPGTWIGYDDWGSTARWSAGESQAHLEMARKHGVRFELKWNNCRKVQATNPLVQTVPPGADVACPALARCRLYYHVVFRVASIERGGPGAPC